jgi:hypothetical protein
MERYHFTRDDALKSICFIENGECYQRSEAFFYIVSLRIGAGCSHNSQACSLRRSVTLIGRGRPCRSSLAFPQSYETPFMVLFPRIDIGYSGKMTSVSCHAVTLSRGTHNGLLAPCRDFYLRASLRFLDKDELRGPGKKTK